MINKFAAISFLFVLILSSCSKYQQLLKSSDNDLKYEKAIEYFNEGKYNKALVLFEELKSAFKGTKKNEDVVYYTAHCHYKQKDYTLASYYLKNYARNFPKNDKAEECLYLSAYCYYLNSPKYTLDQSVTIEAMRELQHFINTYPESDKISKCNELLDELRGKLETKAFETANLYFNLEDYLAAIVLFENILKEFPETGYKEEILFHILKARYLYADKSIEFRKKERFEKTLEACEVFISSFPESKYLKEVNDIQAKSLKNIN